MRPVLPTLMSYLQSHLMSVAESVPRKRKRSFQKACETDGKHQKSDDTTREARRAARDRFWNTLSKVWITPRALREFDRRNAAQISKQRRTTDDLKPRSRKRPFVDTSYLSAAPPKDLKRFARRGGPSLVDLRSVSRTTVYIGRTNAYVGTCSVQNHHLRRPKP